MPGTRRSGVKKMPPNLASGLKRTKETKASEELERVRGWVKAAVGNSDAYPWTRNRRSGKFHLTFKRTTG